MPRIERNFEQMLRNLKRDVVELKRTSQASLVGYVDKETGKIKDTLEDLNVDARTPAAPVELVTDFYVYESFHEKLREGFITITSAPVTKATDGSDIQVAKYEMWARSAVYEEGSEPTFELQSSAIDPSLRSLPVEQYKPYEVMIRAVTLTGRPGLFSEVKTVTVTDDDAPPPMPSKLTLDQGLAVVNMTWDGLSFGETLMPLDFWRTEIGVRYGGAADYTVITEWFEEAGIRYYTGAPVNELLYISHRSYDYAGNVSEWTEPATITVTPVVDEESIRLRLEEVQNIIDQVGDELDQTRLQLTQELSDAEDRLDQNDQLMDQLINTDLPALNQELDDNTGIINNLNDVVLPDLNTRLSDAEGDLAQSKIELDGRLEQAETDIGNAESNLTNLSTVTIPALNTRLDNAQSEIDTNQTELTNRLDDAFLDIGTAQDTADGAVTAASDAQVAADLAKAEAERLWGTVARSYYYAGDTMEGLDFPGGTSNWSIAPVSDGFSTSVLRKTAGNGTVYLRGNRIPFDPDALYRIQFKVRAIVDDPAMDKVFYGGVHAYNSDGFTVSANGDITTSSAHYFAAGSTGVDSSDGWVTCTGYFRGFSEAPGGYHPDILDPGGMHSTARHFSPMALLDYSSGSGTWDLGMVSVDIIAPEQVAMIVAAQSAADDAAQAAQDAHDAAGTAQSRADAAYTMAGTKNAVYYSSSEPSGNGTSAGDLWRRRNSSREVIGEWQWTGSAWEKQTVSGSNVSNMDIGYLTAGAADISDAVIDKLWADVITARKIVASQVLVGQGGNELIDPSFNDFDVRVARQKDMGAGWYWSQYNGEWTAARVTDNLVSSWSINNGAPDELGDYIPVTADTEYAFTIDASGTYDIFYWVLYDTGATGSPGDFVKASDSDTSRRSATYTQKFGDLRGSTGQRVVAVRPTIRSRASDNFIRVYGVRFSAMTDGSLIVNGSISGDHLDVNSVAAKVATVMKLDVGSLTASSATISTGVINKLWADVISARKITTDMLIVGQGTNLIPWNLQGSGKGLDNVLRFHGSGSDPVWGGTDSVTPGAGHLILNATWVDPGVSTNTWRIFLDPTKTPWGTGGFPVEPGQEYQASAYFKSGGIYPDGTPDMQVAIIWYTGEGKYTAASASPASPLTWAWNKHEVSAKAPPTAAYAHIYVRQNRQGQVRLDLPSLRLKTDGGLIVTGSITGDHLEVNSVATKVATVIKLNASTITSGTINTARLNTTEIAAKTANIQKVNASNIVATSATFDDAVINKLWAEVISARKITADQVLVGSGLNVLPNAGFTNEAWDGFGRNPRNGPDGQPSIWLGGQKTVNSPVFKVEGGKKYKFIHSFMQSEFSSYYIQIVTDGGNLYLVNNNKYSYKNTWYENIEVEFTMPEGATYARIRFYGNHANGSVTTGYQWYTNLGLFQMTDASLVVDGAILAKHITASQSLSAKVGRFLKIEAGMIKANAVTAGTIAGGAIDGKVITGANVRTSSSSSRVEMNSTGLHAWKSNVKTFQLLASTGSVTAEGGVFTGSTFRTTSNSSRGIQMDKYYLRAWNRSGGETLRVSASTGDVTLTGGTLQTTSASNRGVKFDSSGFRAYDSVGNVMVDIGGSFNRFAGRIASGPSSEPGATILPSSEHADGYSGYWLTKNAGVMGGSETAGIWLKKPSVTYHEPLQVRGLNNGGVNIWGRLYARDMYAGEILGPGGYYKIKASNGSWFKGSVEFKGRLLAKNTPSTTLMTNAHIAVDGTLYKSSSAARYKLFPLAMDESYDDKILSIEAKTWIDKRDAEATGELMAPVTFDRATNPDSGELPSTASGTPLRRVPGVIAEEVRDAGLDEFVIYDGDGQVEGVMYERLGVALIPVVKRLRERVVSLEGNLSDAIGRLDAAGL